MRHIVTILLIFVGSLTHAQTKENLIVRKYTQKDGINSYNIRRVTEDNYGFIWIATQDGLSRFDGKSFIPYTKTSAVRHRICGVDIREIFPDSANDLLWVLPGETGINAINTLTGNVVKTIPIESSNNEDWNICMLKSGHYLWVGTFTGLRLYDIAQDRFQPLASLKNDHPNPVRFEVRSVLEDHNGNIWVGYSGYGVVVYDGRTKNILRTINISALNDYLGNGSIRFLRSVESEPGTILFATNQGLRKIGYNSSYDISIDNQPCSALPSLNTEPLEYISRQKENILVAGPGGLLQFDLNLHQYTVLEEHSGPTDSKWLNAVQCIFPDKQDNLWLGCQEGLAFISGKKSPFKPFIYDAISRIKLDHVRYIYPLPNGDILAGLWYGIVHIDHQSGEFTIYDKAHTYQHIFQDKAGRVIVSRPDGLFVFNKGKATPIAGLYPEFANWPGVYINSHIQVNDSLIVLGTESNSGILLWDPLHKKIRQIGKDPGILSSNIVNNIHRDARGRLWVLSDNVISIISPDLTENHELVLPHKLFFDMCEAGGYYWIASYGSGLLQLDSSLQIKKVINTSNGLVNDDVYQIYNLSDKQLLVTSNNGISLVDLASYKCRSYSSEDGLHSNGFEEVSGMRKGNYIYAGGLNGFTVIDVSRFRENTTPPVFYFSRVNAQLKGGSLDTGDLHLHTLSVPNTWLQTNVSFIGLNFASPAAVRYQYRILEQDTSWLRPGTQATLNLIGLAPGSYTLEARAANEDGYWSAPVRLALTFLPKWYETLWFRSLVLFAIGTIIYALYRFRIGEFRKQQQIRTGIANDLHDDIGSLLNSMKVFSHLAKKEPSCDEHFQNIDESLIQATTGLRDMIWVLDNSEDTINELMDRIKKYALPVTAASGIRFEYSFRPPEKRVGITKTEKRNLLLIAKEAINNSIKYADCRTIMVECVEDRNGIFLRIEDDGRGFNTTQPSFGNGLRNMTERARQIQYHCSIHSVTHSGTCIIVSKNRPTPTAIG